MATIWVYKPPSFDYFIAKQNAFEFRLQSRDSSGYATVQIIQGMPIPKPRTWDWKEKIDGAIFAGLNGCVYEITDLERPLFMFPQ